MERSAVPVRASRCDRRPMLALLIALALLTSACGSRVAPQRVDPIVRDDSPPARVESDAPTQESRTDPASATPRPDATVAPTPQVRPSRGPTHDNGALTISLSAPCVAPGGVLVATMKAPPRAGMAMAITYADQQLHGAMNTGESDDRGVFVWRVVVAPDAPDGIANLLAGASGPNWGNEGGGSAEVDFRVSRTGC